MRAALHQATKGPLRRVHEQPRNAPPPPWPAPPQTLHALHAHGLLTHTRRRNRRGHWIDEWTITHTGLRAVDPPRTARRDRPEFLRAGGGTTHNPRLSIDTTVDGFGRRRALDLIDVADLDPRWAQHARARHEHARDRREAARALARRARAA
jgi:hypothetical protein